MLDNASARRGTETQTHAPKEGTRMTTATITDRTPAERYATLANRAHDATDRANRTYDYGFGTYPTRSAARDQTAAANAHEQAEYAALNTYAANQHNRACREHHRIASALHRHADAEDASVGATSARREPDMPTTYREPTRTPEYAAHARVAHDATSTANIRHADAHARRATYREAAHAHHAASAAHDVAFTHATEHSDRVYHNHHLNEHARRAKALHDRANADDEGSVPATSGKEGTSMITATTKPHALRFGPQTTYCDGRVIRNGSETGCGWRYERQLGESRQQYHENAQASGMAHQDDMPRHPNPLAAYGIDAERS